VKNGGYLCLSLSCNPYSMDGDLDLSDLGDPGVGL
jgi:hypothetical protein